MNDHDHTSDPWEDEMTSEFDRRVRDLHEAPLTLDQVKGKAMNIRQRRRAAIAGGILAAAAVIVPVAVLATGTGDDPAQPPPATSTPTATDPATPSTPPVTNAGPAYVEGDTFHRADGTVTTLPSADYTDIAVLGDELAAYRYGEYDDNGNIIGAVDLIEDGAVTKTYDVRSFMATAPDGATVAFVTTDDELLFVNGEHGEQSFGEVDPDVTVSAIIGDGDCALESGCHPFLEHNDFSVDGAYEINYEGPDTEPAPGALRVNDAGDDFLVSVTTEVTDGSSCGGLYDRQGGGRWIFQTCDYEVNEISPTGEYTSAFPEYYDGLGPGELTLLDATGEAVAELTPKDGVVGRVAWLDDTHVVADVYDDGAWKIVSLGVDGEMQVLVEDADAPIEESPYRLTAQ